MKPKLKYKINANFSFADYIQALMEKFGVEVKPLREIRSKVMGFMGESGTYQVDDLTVDDYSHYQKTTDKRRWGIKAVDGNPSFTFAEDEDGIVWYNPKSFAEFTDEGWEMTAYYTNQ